LDSSYFRVARSGGDDDPFDGASKMKLSRAICWVVLVTTAVFYLVPMLAMTRFAFQRIPVIKLAPDNIFTKWTIEPLLENFAEPEFQKAALLSSLLAIATVITTLLLLVPTMVAAHLHSPRARKWIEASAVLPFVVPAIALVVGFARAFRDTVPILVRNPIGLVPLYVITALPFTHRALENGLASLDLRTLVNASRSLGAGWVRTIILVVAPNIRASIATASFLAFTVVLGEFTIASLLLKNTLPLYLAYAQGQNPQGSFALGLVLIVLSTLLVALSNRYARSVPA
jgi:putative spermidine/putrescine transport system permease protein